MYPPMINIENNGHSHTNKPSTYGYGLLTNRLELIPAGIHPVAETVYVPWGTNPPAGVPYWTLVFPVVPIAESGVTM